MNVLRRSGALVALVVACIFGVARYAAFLTSENVWNVLRQNSMLGLVALGMTFVILSGGIDLSVGALLAVAGVVAATLAPHGSAVAVTGGVAMAATLGALNGVLIAKSRIQPFIVTLAMAIAARGAVLAATAEQGINIGEGAAGLAWLGRGMVGAVPSPVVLLFGAYLIGAVVLHYTRFGRHLYAIGDDRDAARLMGLRIDRLVIGTYALSGALAGVAGVVLAARLGAGQPVAGTGWELDAIAAVVVGGTLLTGGQGGAGSTLIGVLLLGVIFNLFNLEGTISPWWQWVLRGGFLLGVVMMQGRLQRRLPGRARALALVILVAASGPATAQSPTASLRTHESIVGTGWARSSVNTVIFRTSSIVSHGDLQYTAYYDDSARVVLAQRRIGTDRWDVTTTAFTNDVTDAHNAIALAVDGHGVLHVAWAEHGRSLHYARAVRAGSLQLGAAREMTGQREARVTYPQFYALRGGDLLFLYRDGASGNGDLMLNRWDVRRQRWRVVAQPLISGEGVRNAYVNLMAIDSHGGWHLSWCWRESPDVATNHDVMYAVSRDEGRTWRTSTGQRYALPITARTAEVAWPVPQRRELINQTSMAVDGAGHPMIATYWRAEGSEVPQFQLVWHDGVQWHASQVGTRTQAFRLSGGGTKRIPVSRPLVLAGGNGTVHVVFRDAERGDGISVATSTDAAHAAWQVSTLSTQAVGQWEPTHDPIAWQRWHRLFLFVERVGQGDGESLEDVKPQPISILEWLP